jgi:hypothetical protein
MTVGQLKAVVAGYLKKPVSDFVVGSGNTSTDLLLLALNNARKVAEKFFDFSICRKRGYLSVTTNGDWTAPTWFSTPNPTVTMRKVKNWYMRVSGTGASGEFAGTDRVLRAITKDQQVALYRRQDYLNYPSIAADRYPADSASPFTDQPLLGQPYVVVDGRRFQLDPVPTAAQIIVLDGYYWWNNWTVDADTDWWTTTAEEFLMYRAMVEANRLNQMFVGNAELNLPPPTKEADRALAELVSLDQDASEGSIHIQDL